MPSQAFCEGYIFAVAAAPEIPMPEEWMPGVVNGSNNNLDATQVSKLADAMMFTLRDSLKLMRDGKTLLPEYVVWADEKPLRVDAEQWLSGLLMGHQSVEGCWQQAWHRASQNNLQLSNDEPPAKRLTRCLKFFSSLADVELALLARSKEQASAFREKVPALYGQLPRMLSEYVSLADELAQSLPNQFETFSKQ
nr:UPF0149 family protein [Alteromonas ponticola]